MTVDERRDSATSPALQSPTAAEAAALEKHVLDAILEVAPDLSPSELEAGSDLHYDLGLDSIDLLNIVGSVAARTGVEIPESVSSGLQSVGELVDCVLRQSDASR